MTEYVYFPLLVQRAPNGLYYIGTMFGGESTELWDTAEQAQEALDKDLWSLDRRMPLMNDYLNLDDILFAAGRYARHNCDEDVCSTLDVERNFARDWRTHEFKTQWDRTHPQKEEFIQKSRWSY